MPEHTFELVADWSQTLPGFIDQQKPSHLFVLVDAHTRRHCLPRLLPFLPKPVSVIAISPGEEHKTLETCSLVWSELSRKKADRKAVLLNLGGGVIGDLGGFCAATYKRGIRFVQIPTTLLAMADACLGGKTGVDFLGFKNQVGVFREPDAVWVDPVFLHTLPGPELLSGFAEVVKHALIADAPLWHPLRRTELASQDWPKLIGTSLLTKQRVVREDPEERGLRQILNAGHSLGHALESLFLEAGTPQPHGFCVAAGLLMESHIATGKGRMSETDLAQIEEFVFAQFGALPLAKDHDLLIWKLLLQDKKNGNGTVRMALIGPVGQCTPAIPVSRSEVIKALQYYRGE